MPFSSVPTPDIPEHQEIAFYLFGLPIAWYGIMILIGFSVAIFCVCMKLWKWYKIPVDPFYWFLFLGIPSAILGARFWSCCIGDASWEHFFNFRNGGLAIEGGVMLVVIEAIIYFPLILKKPKYQIRDLSTNPQTVKKISVWLYADAIIPAILIGQVIGRYGNYFNQELYGSVVTDEGLQTFLYYVFPYMYIEGMWHQPLFFYESIINFVGFILLFFAAEFIPKKKAGDIGLAYFVWYGIVRLIMEPLRSSQYSFTLTYWMTALWIILGVTLIIMNHIIFAKNRMFSLWKSIQYFFINNLLKIKLCFKKHSFIKTKNSKKALDKINKEYELEILELKKRYRQKKDDYQSKRIWYHNEKISIKEKFNDKKINFLKTLTNNEENHKDQVNYLKNIYNKQISLEKSTLKNQNQYLYYMGR